MDLKTYNNLALRTAKDMGSPEMDFVHAVLGLMSELYEADITSSPEGTSKELGDVCWYFPLACRSIDTTVDKLFDPEVSAGPDETTKSVTLLTGQAKRFFAYSEPMTQATRDAMLPALQRLFMYAWGWMQDVGDPAAILQANIDKLRKRFPNAYSDADAIARVDVA